MANRQLLTLNEAAGLLRISKSSLYQLRKAGRLPVFRFGRTVRVDSRDLERLMRAARTQGGVR